MKRPVSSVKTGYGSNDILNGELAVVRVKTCPCEYDKDNDSECLGGGYCGQPHHLPVGTFYLPHSCDEWVIGSAKQARQLIKDLEERLVAFEDRPIGA